MTHFQYIWQSFQLTHLSVYLQHAEGNKDRVKEWSKMNQGSHLDEKRDKTKSLPQVNTEAKNTVRIEMKIGGLYHEGGYSEKKQD